MPRSPLAERVREQFERIDSIDMNDSEGILSDIDDAELDLAVLLDLATKFDAATTNGDLLYADWLTTELTEALDAAREVVARRKVQS